MPLPGIFGGFETRQKHFFHIFGARKKIRKFFSQEKSVFIGKNRFFFGKNRDLSEIIGIYPKNRRFFAEIFSNDFFHGFFFSTPTDNRKIAEKSAEISDFFFLAFTSVRLFVPLLALPQKLLSSFIVVSVIQASPSFGSWFLIFLVYLRLSVSPVSLGNILVSGSQSV